LEDFKVKINDWDEKITNEVETILGCDVKVDNLRVNIMNEIKKKDESTIKYVDRSIK
jgi:hypothetical protein